METTLGLLIERKKSFEKGKRIALLIGVGDYEDHRIPSLQFVSKDVDLLYELLSKESSHYTEVVKLSDQEATRNNIKKHLARIADKLSPDDVFLLYFSGHGSSERDGKSYLMTRDTRIDRSQSVPFLNAISVEEILKTISQTKIHTTIFITDACNQIGPLDHGFSLPANMPDNVAGFMSSQPYQSSVEIPDLNHGLFTYYLIEGLKGKADLSNKGVVTIFDLHRYVSRRVQDYASAKGLRQTPILNYRGFEDTPIIDYPKSQEELDAQRTQKEVNQALQEMKQLARMKRWAAVLDKWDEILNLDPTSQGFSMARKAREMLDKKIEKYELYTTQMLISYPRIWPCKDDKTAIDEYAVLTHSDVQKGDILLKYEIQKEYIVIICSYLATTDAFPAGDKQGKVGHYVIGNNKIDLSHSPVPLDNIQEETNNENISEIVQNWEKFEEWKSDLRAMDVWDEWRFALLKEHTYQARRFLQAELMPLEYGLSQDPENKILNEAVEHLFSEYEKIAKLSESQFRHKELESLQKEFWEGIRRPTVESDKESREEANATSRASSTGGINWVPASREPQTPTEKETSEVLSVPNTDETKREPSQVVGTVNEGQEGQEGQANNVEMTESSPSTPTPSLEDHDAEPTTLLNRQSQQGDKRPPSQEEADNDSDREGTKDKPFAHLGKLIDQLVRTLAQVKGLGIGQVSEEIGARTDYSKSTVYRWRRGSRRPSDEILQVLAQIGRQEAGLDHDWEKRLFEAAGYPEVTPSENVTRQATEGSSSSPNNIDQPPSTPNKNEVVGQQDDRPVGERVDSPDSSIKEGVSQAEHQPESAPEPEIRGATRLQPPSAPDLSETVDETQIIFTTIHNNIWQNIVKSVKDRQFSSSGHILDIHIHPHFASQQAEAKGAINSEDGGQRRESRQYWVVLTFREQSGGQLLEPRYFEGPLLLDKFEEEYQDHSKGHYRYGQALYSALLHDELPENKERLTAGQPGRPTLLIGFTSALESARSKKESLRVQLRIDTKAIELHKYQWEYLWSNGLLREPFACDKDTPFSRVLQVSGRSGQRVPLISKEEPLRILAAMASPDELDLENQKTRELQGFSPIGRAEIEAVVTGLERFELIENLEGDNLLVGIANEKVTLKALVERLRKAEEQRRPFHVLHLLCHGLIGDNGKSYLVLEQEKSPQAHLVAEEKFSEMMRPFVASGLRLVVLASCFTAVATGGQALQGVARRLVEDGLPAVIAMQHKFEYVAAQHFSQRLYTHLIHYGEIDRATNAARWELRSHRKEHSRDRKADRVGADEWGVPVLFMRLADGRLFEIDENARQLSLSDLKAKTEIFSYEDMPSADPRRLAEGMMRTLSNQLGLTGLTLKFDSVEWAQKPKEPIPQPAKVVEEQHGLFNRKGEEERRWALIEAIHQYRQLQARRTVLFLRARARTKIAKLIAQEELDSLTAENFRKDILLGGYVRFGTEELTDILEGGAHDESLLTTVENMRWCVGQRGFKSDGHPVAEDEEVRVIGNLTWSDEGHQLPDEGQLDIKKVKELLKKLIYGHGNTFKAFEIVIENAEATGLSQRTASLLLHAKAPNQFIPYHDDLAKRVLGELGLYDNPRYDNGFQGYCALARDLLIDHDLGFEDLADVSYFLQRLAEKKVSWEITDNYPSDLRFKLQTVAIKHQDVITDLVLREGVLEQAIAALNTGKHIILIGPPGTGKTSLAQDLCRSAHDRCCNRQYTLVTATADWTTFDTIGGYMPESGNQLTFRPGIFLEAIDAGKWLIIDEINRANIDKAFGELFTVLSGQVVTLPYKVDGQPVRILPPGHPPSAQACDYVIHPSWRIIGTMNVYDKASLFSMSYALMRRFGFIDVAIPNDSSYKALIEYWFSLLNFSGHIDDVKELLLKIFKNEEKNPLMRFRALGPAIAKDVVEYLASRSNGNLSRKHLIEALLLYVVPQFDGLERESILEIYGHLYGFFPEGQTLRNRIEELFPFVPSHQWKARQESGR